MREITVKPRLRPNPEPVLPQTTPGDERRRPTRLSLGTETSVRRRPGVTLLYVWIGLLLAICVGGYPYYSAPMAERVRSPLHAWLKPAGYIGQSAGLMAIAIFLFLWLYPIRKRVRWLAWTGSVARWLDVHVLAALGLPLLVAIHSAWRFSGLIGLGFWSMMIVWASGIVGRYVYARIPRGQAGIALTLEEIAARQRHLLEQIATKIGLDVQVVARTLTVDAGSAERPGVIGTFVQFFRDDWQRRRGASMLRRLWEGSAPRRRSDDRVALHLALQLARRQMALTQQGRMLDATQALFRFWHVLHRPVAVAALFAVLIHVFIVVALGATWLW